MSSRLFNDQFRIARIVHANEEAKMFRVTSHARQNVLDNISQFLFLSFLKLQMAMIREANLLSCIIRQPSDFPTLGYPEITFLQRAEISKSREKEDPQNNLTSMITCLIDSWNPFQQRGFGFINFFSLCSGIMHVTAECEIYPTWDRKRWNEIDKTSKSHFGKEKLLNVSSFYGKVQKSEEKLICGFVWERSGG